MTVNNPTITTLTSQPSFLPTHVDGRGASVNVNGQRRSLAQAGGFGGVDSPENCMICHVKYGNENPHGAHGVNIRVPGPPGQNTSFQWVDIHNFGATEIAVRMPCGHIVGSNCIVPYFFCPRCQTSLLYTVCNHRIPLQIVQGALDGPAMPFTFDLQRCTPCRVRLLELNAGLSGILADAARLQDVTATPGLQEEAKTNLRASFKSRHDAVEMIKQQTDAIIEQARSGGYE
jgi:hypothetical protein